MAALSANRHHDPMCGSHTGAPIPVCRLHSGQTLKIDLLASRRR
jgi:hypothetical protein